MNMKKSRFLNFERSENPRQSHLEYDYTYSVYLPGFLSIGQKFCIAFSFLNDRICLVK